MNHYLDLDYKTGQLYEYSRDQQAGYREHTNTQGGVSYRRYYRKGVYGFLESAYIATPEGRGMQLRIKLVTDQGTYTLKFPIYAASGRLDSYMESLIKFLPSMEKGVAYRIFPYVLDSERNGKSYQYKGVSVKIATEVSPDGTTGKVEAQSIPAAIVFPKKDVEYNPQDPTQVPKLVFEEGLDGKMKPTALSMATQKQFLEGVLKKAVEALDNSDVFQSENQTEQAAPAPQPQTPPQTPTPAMKEAPQTSVTVAEPELDAEDDDDVPF